MGNLQLGEACCTTFGGLLLLTFSAAESVFTDGPKSLVLVPSSESPGNNVEGAIDTR